MLPADLDWLAVVTGIMLGVGVMGAALLLTREPPLSAHRWPRMVPLVPWWCAACRWGPSGPLCTWAPLSDRKPCHTGRARLAGW